MCLSVCSAADHYYVLMSFMVLMGKHGHKSQQNTKTQHPTSQ